VEVVPSPNGAEGKIRVEFADESRKIFKPKELSFIRPEKAFDKVGDLCDLFSQFHSDTFT